MEHRCHCGRIAVERTSWTDNNPGRRYVACDDYWGPQGCIYIVWIDPPVGERARQIIPELLRRINNLEADVVRANNSVAAAAVRNTHLEEELARVYGSVRNTQAEEGMARAHGPAGEVQQLRRRCKWLLFALLVSLLMLYHRV